MVKINIQSKKEERDKQRQDIVTYYNMIDELVKKINEVELHMSWIDQRPERKKLNKGLELSVEIIPLSLSEDDQLTRLYIRMHKKEALDIVKNVLKDYSDKYNYLKSVDINTYF